MSCKDPCTNCDRKGLPILFTRYAAAYSALTKGTAALKPLAPSGQFQAKPNGVAMKAAQYNVRMLRPGYLYVRIESSSRGPKWYGYIVHPHGYLAEFPVEAPEAAKPNPACEVEIRGSIASMVWVADAKSVTNFNFMFHPDPIDYQRLKSEIEPNLGKYTQSFDVAGWANGSMNQKDTCTPALLNAQVVEFAALNNEALRDAIEPQMYGLMGANPQERGWGDYEYVENRPIMTVMGASGGREDVAVNVKGHTYLNAHDKRLKKITEVLKDKKGAVVACEDPVGIAQELGYLQAEAWTPYTHWQNDQCPGHFKGVTNEWVYQAALGATGLMEMVKKGAVAKTEAHIRDWNANAHPAPTMYADEATRASELARRDAAKTRNQQRERDHARLTGDTDYAALFDQGAARDVKAAQLASYNDALDFIDALGTDQVSWLKATALMTVIDRYSPLDPKIHLPGGGAALSLQLAQSMAGIESNKSGKALLQTLDPAGWNLLGRAMSFNSVTVQATLHQLNTNAAPAALPGAEPTTAVADWITDKLKFQAGKVGLGDKALGFMEAAPCIADSATVRRMAWPLHIASLMSVKMMQTVAGLPVLALEARVVRFAAMTGITTLGSTAGAYAQTLATAERSRVLNAVAQLERKSATTAIARVAVPNSRAAALSALFDVGFALIKGYQLKVKADARTSVEMVGNVLQGIGSIADFRAKAYEETVQKGMRGKNLFTAVAQAESLDLVNGIQLRAMRLTAFKFLLPAAMISVWWDVTDALLSFDRKRNLMSGTQFAGALGTIFTITATGMLASGALFGVTATTWAATAATLGLIGAVMVLGAFLMVLALREDEWLSWLRDNPLNKERKGQKPIHKNLENTLQQLANAQAAA